MAKVFYDDTIQKEVIDISESYTKQDCVDKFGFSSVANTQEVTLTEGLAHEVVAGMLQTFNLADRLASEASARESARLAKEEEVKTANNWTDQQWQDIKEALGM